MTEQDLERLGPAFAEYLGPFRRCFPHRDTARHFDNYCRGLLSDLPRKSVEPIALASGTTVRTLQVFLANRPWNQVQMRTMLHQQLAGLPSRDHRTPFSTRQTRSGSDAFRGATLPGPGPTSSARVAGAGFRCRSHRAAAGGKIHRSPANKSVERSMSAAPNCCGVAAVAPPPLKPATSSATISSVTPPPPKPTRSVH